MKPKGFAACIALCLSTSVMSGHATSLETDLRLADQAFRSGDFDAALGHYAPLIKRTRRSPTLHLEVMLSYARALLGNAKIDEALQAFQDIVIKPQTSEKQRALALNGMAVAHMMAGRLHEARERLLEASVLLPDDARIQNNLARIGGQPSTRFREVRKSIDRQAEAKPVQKAVPMPAIEPYPDMTKNPVISKLYLQHGAFAIEQNAYRLRNELNQTNLSASANARLKTTVSGRLLTFVFTGPYSDQAARDDAVAQVNAIGHPAIPVVCQSFEDC